MAICASGEKWVQEATGVRRGRVHPVANKIIAIPISILYEKSFSLSWGVGLQDVKK